MDKRGSGILLHITSLPSSYGIGDLGPEAYRFADFLRQSRQSYWQVLPLNPTNPIYGNSPYSSVSAFAGNTLLISFDMLLDEGFLARGDLDPMPSFPEGRCDFSAVIPYKNKVLEQAYQRFRQNGQGREPFEAFCSQHASWLDDFALFSVLKKRFDGRVWNQWPTELRDRDPLVLEEIGRECHDQLEKERFLQFLFFKQWHALKGYCRDRGVKMFGDIAIYVSFDSADIWANPDLFNLDGDKRPVSVSGVPPDYFSQTGQLWGNPLYCWDALKKSDYRWWKERIAHNLGLFDLLRIDHFRGLVAYWEVPAGEKTAVNGQWSKAPADDFLASLKRNFSHFPVVAEDLGVITPDVREVMDRFGMAGMKVLMFAFGEDNHMHPFLPHTYEKNCVAYTGTHDNNTVRGWFEKETSPDDKRRLFSYLGEEVPAEEVHRAMCRLAMMSVARMVILPMQDILGLGEEARMNRPSIARGNWEWRLAPDRLISQVADRLRDATETSGRCSDG